MLVHVFDTSRLVDLDVSTDVAEWRRLIALFRAEADALERLIPDAIDVQCLPSPRLLPREDTSERAKNTRSNPTLEIVLDEGRLQLSGQLVRSRNLLRRAVVALRGVRRGLEISMDAWSGESEDE